MGWGTTFKAEIYLNRQIFQNRYELDEKIKEIEGFIESSKRELTALAVSTPKDVMAEKDSDGYVENPIDQILRRTAEIFEWMEENYRNLHQLYEYQQYLDENPEVDMKKLNDI